MEPDKDESLNAELKPELLAENLQSDSAVSQEMPKQSESLELKETHREATELTP